LSLLGTAAFSWGNVCPEGKEPLFACNARLRSGKSKKNRPAIGQVKPHRFVKSAKVRLPYAIIAAFSANGAIMFKHFNLKITGKVQGVWYRGSACNKARELGLRGFVRNLPDGSVYAEVEGEAVAVESFIAWCWEGPPLARVGNIETSEAELRGFSDFQVVR
jgi:acylphosphatase